MQRNTWLGGVLFMLLATFSTGASFPVSKLALGAIDPFYLSVLRYGGAAAIFLSLLLWREGREALHPGPHFKRVLWLGTLGFGGGVSFMYYGLAYSRPEQAAVIVATQPLLAAFAHWAIHGKRPSLASFAAIGVALLGVIVVVTRGHPASLLHGSEGWGAGLILIGSLCWVLYTLGAAQFPHWSPLRFTTLTATGGAGVILVIALLASLLGQASAPSAPTVASMGGELAFITVFGAVFATLSWNQGIRRIGMVNGVLFANFVPITALLIGLMLGHDIRAIEWFGVALVSVALFANTWQAQRRSAHP